MPTLLFEQPWVIGLIGAILSIVGLFGWLQTGNAIAWKSSIGFAVATLILLLLNLWVVTDREVVRSFLIDAAGELQRNEYDKVLARLHPSASDSIANHAQILPTIKFSVARITKFHSIEILMNRTEPKATVRMNVFLEAETRHTAGKVPRWVSMSLEKVQGRWLITDLEHRAPQHEFMKTPNDLHWSGR
jgi:hypothetical protein